MNYFLDDLARYITNVDYEMFMIDIYDDIVHDDYHKEKFTQFQNNFIQYWNCLDEIKKRKLIEAISKRLFN
jgi:hypothetical protein